MTALETYSGRFKVFDGVLDVTTGYSARYYVVSEVECSVNIDLMTGVYTITDVTDDNASAIFVAKYNGQALYKTFTIAKSRELYGPGSAKRIVLSTSNYDFSYDEHNQPANETASLTVGKFNTTALTTWRLRKLDGAIIAEGTAASLVSGGYATSSANPDQLSISEAAFNALIVAQSTNAIVVETEVIDGIKTFSDRVTLFQLVQKNKVTFEQISDPTGAKAQLIQTANDAGFVSNLLNRTVDDLLTRQVQTASNLHINIGRVERTTSDKFLVEQTKREELAVSVGTTAVNLANEITVRAGLTDALAFQYTDLSATVGGVSAALTTESSTRASADSALSTQYTNLSATLGTLSANLTTEITARTDADSALTSLYNSLNASFGTLTSNLATEVTARVNGDQALSGLITTLTTTANGIRADLTTETSTRTSADSALSTLITNLTSRMNNYITGVTIEAALATNASAIATANGAISSLSTTLQADYNGKIGTINSTLSSTVSALGVVQNRWALSLNSNGSVAGLVLANGSDSKSIFAIQADKLYLYDTGGSGTAPFYVSGGTTYLQNASIANGAITNAKIGSLAVGTGNIQNLAVDTLQLAGNAVTIPVAAYTAGTVNSVKDVWTDIQTASLTSTGAPIVILASMVQVAVGGYTDGWQYRILRNGTSIYSATINTLIGSGGSMPFPLIVADTPGAGAITYTVQFMATRNGEQVKQRFVQLLEVKK